MCSCAALNYIVLFAHCSRSGRNLFWLLLLLLLLYGYGWMQWTPEQKSVVYNISCDWRPYVAPVCCSRIHACMYHCPYGICPSIQADEASAKKENKIEKIILSQWWVRLRVSRSLYVQSTQANNAAMARRRRQQWRQWHIYVIRYLRWQWNK